MGVLFLKEKPKKTRENKDKSKTNNKPGETQQKTCRTRGNARENQQEPGGKPGKWTENHGKHRDPDQDQGLFSVCDLSLTLCETSNLPQTETERKTSPKTLLMLCVIALTKGLTIPLIVAYVIVVHRVGCTCFSYLTSLFVISVFLIDHLELSFGQI